MAEIRSYGFVRHLRSEPASFLIHYRAGQPSSSGRGLSLWFAPLRTALAEVPVDDREVQVLVHGRSRDYQDVTVQGSVTYRILEPLRAADRVDFSIDARRGTHLRQPLERIAQLVVQLFQESSLRKVVASPLADLLGEGSVLVRDQVSRDLQASDVLHEMGIVVVTVQVASIRPTPELEKALEAPSRELLQQGADEAVFTRRALAVEKERAIQENELNNRLELARREESLIEQQGRNRRREVDEAAAAERIEAQAAAERNGIAATSDAEKVRLAAGADSERIRLQGAAQAESLEQLERARAEGTRLRMDSLRDVAPAVLVGLALQEIAGKLQRIEHVQITPDTLGAAIGRVLEAGVGLMDRGKSA